MDFQYIDYIITQNGHDLTTPSSIKLYKMENKVTRLIFEIEDWLKEFRLYLAIFNPETKRYHYEPLLVDKRNDMYYFIIGTRISYYPGKVQMILVGVEPDFELDDNVTIDTTNTVFISKEFVRAVVINNFIDDAAFELSMPTLDQKLDDLVVLHDNVSIFYDHVAQDLVECDEDLVKCNEDVERCEQAVIDCDSALESCTVAQEVCVNNKTQSEEILDQCQQNLTESRQILSDCVSARQSANSILSQCQGLLNQMNTSYQNYMAQMQAAYNQYIEDLRNERSEP